MFVDLRGYTRLSAHLSPGELLALVGDFQRVAVPIIRRHRGTIITYLGDGIMVAFGAARSSDTYAADALRCAEALAAAAGGAAEVGIGVDAGPVVCGTIGEEGKLEYAVLGEPVNRAAKLQAHTKEEGVRALATRAALERARAQGFADGRCRLLAPARRVAGVDVPLELVALG
jgi:adenylate cyclase